MSPVCPGSFHEVQSHQAAPADAAPLHLDNGADLHGVVVP